MKYIALLLTPCMLALVGCATLGASSDKAVIRAKDRVAPALVHIRPVKQVYAEGKREEIQIVGSGFIITPDGYVVTNEHVAGESKLVRCVLYDKEEVDAQVVGTDRYTDIAVLKLATDRKNLPAVKLGTSKTLQAGQAVIALGSPHGLARSVSLGIVSVTDRYLSELGAQVSPYNTWIQTDAAINQGNSGGPLVNMRGEVIGVNTRKLGGAENVGFAIPIDIAKEAVDQIIQQGRVIRSWLGLSLQEMTRKTDDPSQKGVVIGDIDPLSPARAAQLQAGDILLSVDGHPTHARFEEELPAVQKLIADLPVGKEVVLRIARGGEQMDVKVMTAEKSDLRGNEVEFKEWGFTATDVTPAVMKMAQLPSKMGILVSGAQVGGIAASARLQPGDIVLRIEGKDIADMAAFQAAYKDVVDAKKRLVLLDVKRGALTRYTLVKQEAATAAAPAATPAGGAAPPGVPAPAPAPAPKGGNGHGQ